MLKSTLFIAALLGAKPLLAEDFQINPGITGTWHNPKASSQGQLIEVLSNQRIFLAWFTYKQEKHHWYFALGEYSANSVSLELKENMGGLFNQVGNIETDSAGSAMLTFTSCNDAVLEYVIEDQGTGSMNLKRLVANSLCEELANED